jgi:hypothetical protein
MGVSGQAASPFELAPNSQRAASEGVRIWLRRSEETRKKARWDRWEDRSRRSGSIRASRQGMKELESRSCHLTSMGDRQIGAASEVASLHGARSS